MNTLLLLMQAETTTKKPGGGFDPMTLMFIALIFVVFYLFMIRPQKKRERERKQMLSQVRKGAQVRTIGGIFGRIVSAKEQFVIIEIDKQSGATIKLSRSAVSEILSEGEDSEEEETEL